MRRSIALPCAVVLALSAAGLAAQQATFRSKTDLVIVDAVVVDKNGQPVRGLRAADFALTEQKRLLPIETFEEVSHERPTQATGTAGAVGFLPPTLKRDVASNTTAQTDRLVMLFIDDLHIWRGRTDTAKALARDIVTRLGGQASMAVMFSSREGSTEITQDRAVLLAAIDGMEGRQRVRRPLGGGSNKAAYVNPEAPVEFKLAAIQEAQRTSLSDGFDTVQHFQTINGAARMLLQEERRRKAFVVVSEGFNGDLSSLQGGGGNPLLGDIMPRSTEDGAPAAAEPRVPLALDNAVAAMKRANVTMYAIDPRGEVDAQDMMRESWPPSDCAVCNNPPALPLPAQRIKSREDSQFRWDNPVRLAQDGLQFMSEAVGGFAVTNTDDLTGGVSRILNDLDHYYLLGFYPPAGGGTATRPMDLTVTGHPEYTVRFRRGYRTDVPSPPLKSSDPLGDLVSGVMPKGDLPLRVTAMALPGGGAEANVAVALEVTAPVGQVKASETTLRDDVTYTMVVVDHTRDKITQRTGRSTTHRIPLLIDLEPGEYQLRASAVSKNLGTGGSVYLNLTVPDFSNAPLALTSIALGLADGASVPVGRSPRDLARLGIARPVMPPAQERAQTSQNPLPFEPTLNREFARSDALRTYFEVVRRERRLPVSLAVRVIDAGNKPRLSHDMVLGIADPGRVDLRIPLETLPPGAYILRVTGADGRNTTKTETGFVVK
jgi:VWFA-related protein